MKRALQVLAVALSITFLGGCAVTVPVKVATKTTKLGVKTAKTGVKTSAKVAGSVIPDGDTEKAKDRE